MRKIVLFCAVVFAFISGFSQTRELETAKAKELVKKHQALLGLAVNDSEDFIVSDSYLSPEGIRMIYLQQSFKGVPVYNQLQVIAFRNDQLLSNKGGRISEIEKMILNPSVVPGLPATAAVSAALAEAKLPAVTSIRPVNESAGRLEYGKLDVSTENITAELVWLPVEGKKLKLAWQVFVAPVNADDMWLIRVDAFSGLILDKTNLTVYDSFHSDEHAQKQPEHNYITARPAAPRFDLQYRMPAVNSASYRVVPYPAESPLHPGGTPALVTDPWTSAPGNATTLKWHNDGTLDHDSTRGNNVWAAEDRNNTNNLMDKAAVSTTPQPTLTFDFVPDFTVAPTTTTPPNQQFNITNLFYWNNIIHDITYLYGFNEVSGNFQNDNMGRGGAAGDYVIADAQDGGGTNNANFATPADGGRPRMQMYLWTSPNPDRDGDVDNSIVVHEFGHGISNRLTGGPSQAGCVSNAEHGGEGWSDFYALMLTTNWAAATPSDGFNIPRGIGTYALGQPPTGQGIRAFRYCTNIAVNPRVYSTNLPSAPHDRGEYLCMALWEMTWEMIQQTGINPDLFNPSAAGGNSAALKLVTEGMKLQPCGPGFIDVRDAILEADTIFFGGLYSCSIWRAFAKRGMGRNASQGSANSVTDQVPSFIVDNGIFTITQSVTQVPEGQNVTYTNHVTAGNCSPMANYFVTDTLPTNVTYVSGGSYNAANRTITFGPINLSSGQSQDFPFTVTVNAGTYFTPVLHYNEQVAGASIPAGWGITPASGNTWTVSTTQGQSPPNSFYAQNFPVITDMQLANTSSYTLNATVSSYTTLSFWHRFNTEDGWDGGVVEISTNSGGTWSDLGSRMVIGKYNGSLGVGSNNPIGGRAAFTGNNGAAFMQTLIDLSSFAGQSVRIRFRFASDDNTAPSGGGWLVDDVRLYTEPAVYMKSSLFNASNLRISTTDTITRILEGAASCIPLAITTQPAVVNGCTGANATFSVVVTGTTPSYQWQVNTGSGFTDIINAAPYAGANSATLTITNITAGMNGYQFRVVLSNTCTASFNSAAGTLNVGSVATITTQPVSSTVCEGATTSFSIVSNGGTSYQWQVNSGSGFVNVSNAAPYSGATTTTLTITGTTAAMTGNQYRVVVGSCGSPINSSAATLVISVPVSITTQPSDVAVCEGANTSFMATISGSASAYQWQLSTNGGTTYNNIPGAVTATYNVNGVMIGQDGYRYRLVATGACGPVTSATAMLTVNPLPVFSLAGLNPVVTCISDPAFTLQAPAGGVWTGTGVQGSSFDPAIAGIGSTTLTYTLTQSGCATAKTTVINVNECSDRHITLDKYPALIVYPNPNNGMFSIRVNTDLYTRLGLKIYNSDGQLLETNEFSNIFYGTVVPVDLTRVPSGTYQLYFYNNEHGFVSRGTSIIIYKK